MKVIIRIACIVLLLFASVVSVFGQSNSTSQQDEAVVVSSNLVTVNVIVTNSAGRYVTGLKPEQFSLYDENVKQKIAHFSAGAAPVSIGIVFEIHSTTPDRVAAVLGALKKFVATLGARDGFFFTAYNADGSVTTEFIPSASQVMDHLAGVKPGGPSALYDVLYTAAGRLRQSNNLKRTLLVISDGQDENSKHSYAELRNRLRGFDMQIYAIGISHPAIDQFAGYHRWMYEDLTVQTGRRSFFENSETATGRAVLGELARVSGGTNYTPESENEPELAAICTQIALELREQYTLGFYPGDLTSRKWHKIKVRVEPRQGSSGFSLSYRRGYEPAVGKGMQRN